MKILTIGKNEKRNINNLYHPTATLELESYDRIEILDCLDEQTVRFLPILLKETFALVKKGGQLNIHYDSSMSDIRPKILETMLWWLFQRQYTIIRHNCKEKIYCLTIRKEKSTLKKENGIDHWSFGMVTNGVRRDFVEKSIQSVRNLKIPHYEIIICGYYPEVKGKDIKYIEFRERDEQGWITKKKNLIAEHAQYTNLCIFHDRIVFNKKWYHGMRKYGNSFEVLSCVQQLENEKRVGDWVSANVPFEDPGLTYRVEEIDYRDWDKYVFMSGQLMIIKKYVWEDVCWNETLYWKEGEDIEYSQRLTERGYVSRFNPFSSCLSLSWGHGQLPVRAFPRGNLPLRSFTDMPIRRAVRVLLYRGVRLPLISRLIALLYPRLTNNSIFKFVRSH